MPGIPLTRVWPCHVKRDGRDKPGHDSWVCLSTQGVRRLEHFPLESTGRDAPATPLAPPLPACGERSDSERSEGIRVRGRLRESEPVEAPPPPACLPPTRAPSGPP